jgi:hypothetical protein
MPRSPACRSGRHRSSIPYADATAFHDSLILPGLLAAPLTRVAGALPAYNLLILAAFSLNGLAATLLVRDLSGMRLPALIAGAIFAFASYHMAHLSHLNLLQSGWMVLALVFLRRLLRPIDAGGARLRDLLACAICAGLQPALAFYYSFFAALLLGGYTLIWAIHAGLRWRRGTAPFPWRNAGAALLAGVLALIVALPFVLPYARVYPVLGITRTLTEIDQWSAPLRAYMSVAAANRLYASLGEQFVGPAELALFPGVAATLLALVALGMNINVAMGRFWGKLPHSSPGLRWEVWFWALLALLAGGLSLGTTVRLERYGPSLAPIPLPYGLLYAVIPGFDAMRVPARWGLLVQLALAVPAGLAVAAIMQRLRPVWGRLFGSLVLVLVLAEGWVVPLPLVDVAAITPAREVDAWLAQPAQRDLQVVLELPLGPLARGDELNRTIVRQWRQQAHWKRLPTGYSGAIPFGDAELRARVQQLPDPARPARSATGGSRYAGLAPRLQYAPGGTGCVAWQRSAAAPELRLRVELGDATVFQLLPVPNLPDVAGASVLVSNDERMPGLLTLGLIRRWQEQGALLYGADRPRFYTDLAKPIPGRVFEYGLLSAAEDPQVYGFSPDDLVWSELGLACFRRAADLVAVLDLGRVDRGMYHPRYPSALQVARNGTTLLLADLALAGVAGTRPLLLEIDLAAQASASLQVGDQVLALEPGYQQVRVPLDGDIRMQALEPDRVALLRVRVREGQLAAPDVQARAGMVAAGTATWDGNRLQIEVQAAGADTVLLEIRGAAAADDRPLVLAVGVRSLRDGEVAFSIDPFQPGAEGIEAGEPIEDGRYIIYIKDPAQPYGAGRSLARFDIRNGALVDFTPAPLPLTLVP